MFVSKSDTLTLKGRGRKSSLSPYEQWSKEVLATDNLIVRLQGADAVGGKKWREGMLRHYRNLMRELLENEPEL